MVPFFSIIIPVFNAGTHLEALLLSILNQSFTDFEVLIMDAVSTDNTIEIAKSFHDDRFFLFSESDKGVYDAMNKGIDVSRGQWLYFIGADDTLRDRGILAKVQSLITDIPTCKWVYGDVVLKGDGLVGCDGQLYDGEFSLSKLLEKNICHQAIFYHKDLFQEIGKYNLGYPILADYDFNLKAFAKHKPRYIKLEIANYYTGGLSNSSTKDNDPFLEDLPFNAIEYSIGENLFKNEFRCLEQHFPAYGRRHFRRHGAVGYLKMRLLKIWHKYLSRY